MSSKNEKKASMIVCFLRHGKSHPPGSVPDEERQLLDEGREQLRGAGPTWRRLGIRPVAVFTSPRQRSIDSAQLFIEGVGLKLRPTVSAALAPGAQWRDFRKLLKDRRVHEALAFVGHEPDLSAAVAHLTGATRVRLQEGGLCCVEVLPSARKGSGVLTVLLDPALYRDEDGK